jgi:ABC-type multidrug transport system fused ATPase/permease subunit
MSSIVAVSIASMAFRVLAVAGVAALYGGAIGVPVDIYEVFGTGNGTPHFWVLALALLVFSALFATFTIAQGELEAVAVKRVICSLSLRQVSRGWLASAGTREANQMVTLPFKLFLPVRTIVSMAPAMSQIFIGAFGIFVLSPPMGALIVLFLPIGAFVARHVARENSRVTTKLLSSRVGGEGEDEEDGSSAGGMDKNFGKFLEGEGSKKNPGPSVEDVTGWLKTREVDSFFRLRRTWRQSRVRGNAFAFVALIGLALAPAVMVEYDIVKDSLLNLAALAGLILAVAQAVSALSGSVAGLGRFHAQVLHFKKSGPLSGGY